MELPEKDITTVDAILFVQNSLKESSDLYNKESMKQLEKYIKRGTNFSQIFTAHQFFPEQ